MSGKWEVAGKGRKSGIPVSKKAAKKQKKEVVVPEETSSGENFPVSNPLKEHQNIFNLMRDSESDNEPDHQQERAITKARVSTAGRGNKNRKKGSPTASSPRKGEREQLLEELEEIDVADLRALVKDVKSRFPNNPRIWLKDIQSYMHMKVTVKEADTGFTMFEGTYPHNQLATELADFLHATFKGIQESVMTHFYLEILDSFAKDTRNGVTSYQHRIHLQSIALACPRTVHSSEVTTRLQAMINDSVSRPRECVALLWCLNSMPRTKLDTKLEVWFTWMLPILQTMKTEKTIQEFIFKCLDDTVKEIAEDGRNVEITPSNFFGYFDLVFTSNNGLLPHIQDVFMDMLPLIKDLAFSSSPQTRLRTFFPSLLIRLQQSSAKQKEVVLNYLLECLQGDSQTWLLWQQMFTKHMASSVLLLEHVHDHWTVVIKTVNKSALKQTLDYLVGILTPANSKLKLKENHRRALALSTDMSHALGSPLKGALKLALLVMVALTVAYVLHDVKEFGSFSASRTGRMYTSFTNNQHVEQLLNNVQEYMKLVHKYGMVHVPVLMEYSLTIYNSISSTLALFFIFIQDNVNYFYENKGAIIEQFEVVAYDAAEKVCSFVKSSTSPDTRAWLLETSLHYWELAVQYWTTGSEFVLTQSSEVWAVAQTCYNSTVEYINTNFVSEPMTVDRLKDLALVCCYWVQQTALYYYETVSNYIAQHSK